MPTIVRFAAALLILSLASCTTTRIYVVRHAEKLDNSADPPLSPAGVERARCLADELAGRRITRVFVSDRKRTQETAAPTAARFNLTSQVLPGRATDQLISELKQLSGDQALVVRHSNELHLIVNALCPDNPVPPITEAEYDNLFVVEKQVFLGSEKIRLERLKYGGAK